MNHYLVVTLNYFIDIISIYGIEISVENLKTKEKQHIQFDNQLAVFVPYSFHKQVCLIIESFAATISMPVKGDVSSSHRAVYRRIRRIRRRISRRSVVAERMPSMSSPESLTRRVERTCKRVPQRSLPSRT